MKDFDLNTVAKDLSVLLPSIQRKFIRSFEQQARQTISPLAFHALNILSEKNTFTMTELAKEMKVSKQQLTPIIDKLIESELISREHDEIDRRMVKINLTAKGIDFLEDFHKGIADCIKHKIEHLDKEDLFLLQNSLTELYKVINKIP